MSYCASGLGGYRGEMSRLQRADSQNGLAGWGGVQDYQRVKLLPRIYYVWLFNEVWNRTCCVLLLHPGLVFFICRAVRMGALFVCVCVQF
jgi:hypothetical protein